MLAPIGILSAYYNGSALQIIAPKVIGTIGTQTAGWLRFYLWMALWIALFCLAWVLRAIPNSWVNGLLCGLAQSACLVLLGRTIGLLAQSFINFWISDSE
jgi:hypothetical protein